MKATIIHLLLCSAPLLSFAQKDMVQKAPNASSNFKSGSENWLDTSNMYNSRYGPVARLTQDNMPCIMAYTPLKSIPNAAEEKQTPNDIPNFWKGEPWKYRTQPSKPVAIPPKLYTPKGFKAPGILEKKN